MSFWTYITGVIEVTVYGNTNAQNKYIIETVLEHMPYVTGSEEDMAYHVIAKHGYNQSSTHNEFGEPVRAHRRFEWAHTQSKYMIVIEGSLRDRLFEETLRELNKWLNRLSKRLSVDDIAVKLTGRSNTNYEHKSIVISDSAPYENMYEMPSWSSRNEDGEPAWWEYLIWDNAKGTQYPLLLCHKYYCDPEVDAEVERRREYYRDRN